MAAEPLVLPAARLGLPLGGPDSAAAGLLPRVRLRRPDEIRDGVVAVGAALLRVLEPLACVAALLGACWLAGRPFDDAALAVGVVAALVTSAQFRTAASGQPWRRAGLRGMYLHLGGCLVATVGLLAALAGVTRTTHVLPAAVIVLWIAGSAALIAAAHTLAALGLRMRPARAPRRAVVVGGGEVGRALVKELGGAGDGGGSPALRCLGRFDDSARPGTAPEDRDVLAGGLAGVADYVNRNAVDLVYITLPLAHEPRVLALLRALRDTTASVYFVPDLLFLELVHARIDHVRGIPVIGVCESPLDGVNALLKRAFDLVFASVALVVLAPLLAAIALAVRLESRGPVLFRQRRYGLGGEAIVVYKFRSMRVLEDGAEITQARRDDPRITAVGAFLRRWSLDELPQFVNVLQGRMSVVGPRPHAVAHNEQYRRLIGGYMLRHKVRPGITGWAQVNGLRGETDTLDRMRARIAYDLDYLRHWSLELDLRIVARTVTAVLRADAY